MKRCVVNRMGRCQLEAVVDVEVERAMAVYRRLDSSSCGEDVERASTSVRSLVLDAI